MNRALILPIPLLFLAPILPAQAAKTTAPTAQTPRPVAVFPRVALQAQVTADPKTAAVTKRADAAANSAPKPVADLQPGVYKYEAKLAIGGQQLSMSISTTIKEEDGAWTVTDVIQTPVGPATDTATLEKGSLTMRRRSVLQGPSAIKIDFEGGKATGSVSMAGKETPIAVDLGGPVFGDGPGGQQAMAALPLAEGYTTSFRQLDLQKQRAKTMQLKVAGSERITVPAGTFDTFRVELSSDDGPDKMTLWVAKDTRQPIKISTALAQAGGATMTEELLQ